MIGAEAATDDVVAGLLATGSDAPEQARLITVSSIPGTTLLCVDVAVPVEVERDARDHDQDWGLAVAIDYLSVRKGIVTVSSGPLSIKNDSQFVGTIDGETHAIRVTVSYGHADPPGHGPGFSGTVRLLPPGSA